MSRLRELLRKVLQVACISHVWVDAAEEVADDGVVFHGGPVEGYDVFHVGGGRAEDVDGHGCGGAGVGGGEWEREWEWERRGCEKVVDWEGA